MFNIFNSNRSQDVRCLLNLLEGTTPDTTKFIQRDYTILPNESYKYIRIDLSMFFSPANMNIRPKQLDITLTNLVPDSCKDTMFYYLHTPLIETQLGIYNTTEFSNSWSFTNTFTLNINTPYLTYFQKNSNNECVDVDIWQLTNVNLTSGRIPDVSFGGLYILPNRISTAKLNYQIQFKLYYLENKY